MSLPDGPFGTVVADPPWRYQKANAMGARTAESHYATMTTEEISALPVASVVAEKAHLYLWVTNPILIGLRPSIRGLASLGDVVRAWGFEPMTILTWVKTARDGKLHRGGLGFYFRGATEHVIFATRGGLGIPSALREPNVFFGERRDHSQKPEELTRLAERMSPAPRLEMFARSERRGWTVWGNESDRPAEPTQEELFEAGA